MMQFSEKCEEFAKHPHVLLFAADVHHTARVAKPLCIECTAFPFGSCGSHRPMSFVLCVSDTHRSSRLLLWHIFFCIGMRVQKLSICQWLSSFFYIWFSTIRILHPYARSCRHQTLSQHRHICLCRVLATNQCFSPQCFHPGWGGKVQFVTIKYVTNSWWYFFVRFLFGLKQTDIPNFFSKHAELF